MWTANRSRADDGITVYVEKKYGKSSPNGLNSGWIQAGDLVDGSGTCFTASRTSTLEEDSPPFAQLGGGLMKVRGALFQASELS